MKKFLWFGSGIAVVLIVAFYFISPDPLFEKARDADRKAARLIWNETRADEHRMVYLEGGTGETIVLLHGFGAEKDNWTRFAKYLTQSDLPQKYHVVIPDIAGFGESARLQNANYDIESQVKRLDKLITKLKLEKFHIAGNSMGGMIAAIYGATYPQKVMSVALLAPGGIVSPVKNDFVKLYEQGVNPLLIKNRADFDRLISALFVTPPSIPEPFMKILATKAISDRPYNEKAWNDVIKNPVVMEPYLLKITVPTLIIWGDKDKLLDVSAVPLWEKALKKRQTVIMKDTGHVPMLEKPKETATAYLEFLKKTTSR